MTPYSKHLRARSRNGESREAYADPLSREPPAVGTLVTYRYRELTPKGMPRFPVFLRVRELP